MNSMADYSAAEIVKIIKACGEAGVTDLTLGCVTMKFKPKWVQEAEVVALEHKPVQLTFVEDEQPTYIDEDLALTDPVAWQRQGMEANRG